MAGDRSDAADGSASVLGSSAFASCGEQRVDRLPIPDVPRGDRRRGDQLRVRIDRNMPLIAIKPAGAGLVAMPRVRVDGRDDPVLRDPPRDPEHPILPLIEVLPDNGGQQRAGLRDALGQLPAV